MLSKIAKTLLVSTSIAPILVTFGIAQFAKNPTLTYLLFIVAFFLLLLCVLILQFCKTKLEKHNFTLKSIKNADQEILTFIIAYLLPLAASSDSPSPNIVTGAFVVLLLSIALFNSNAYHYNPLLGLFRYHFYEVTDENSVTYVMITKANIRNISKTRQVVDISDYMILDLGEKIQ